MKTLNKSMSKLSKNLITCSIPAVLFLGVDPAEAIVNVNFFDEGSNLKIVVSGSLSELGTQMGTDSGPDGVLTKSIFLSGNSVSSPICKITGPTNFSTSGNPVLFGNSVTGLFLLLGANIAYGIDPSYMVGQPFESSATFNGTSLAAQGFTVPGLVGTWTIDGTSESINLFIDPLLHQESPSPAPCPCSVPALPSPGAAACVAASLHL